MASVTLEPQPTPIQTDRPVLPQDTPLSAILKGKIPRKSDSVSATYEVDGPNGKRRIDALSASLLADPIAVQTFKLMRSAQAWEVKEDSDSRLYAESPFGILTNDARLKALINEAGPKDLDDLETLAGQKEALRATLTKKLVDGRNDGSITTLYEGNDNEGQIWIEVLDQSFIDGDDKAMIKTFNEVRGKQAGVTVEERDNRTIAIYRARPATLNSAAILEDIYRKTVEDGSNLDEGRREADKYVQAIFGGARLSPISATEIQYSVQDEPISILDQKQLERELTEKGFITLPAGTRIACYVGVLRSDETTYFHEIGNGELKALAECRVTGQSTADLDTREDRQHPEIHLTLSSQRMRLLQQELKTNIDGLRAGLTDQERDDFDQYDKLENPKQVQELMAIYNVHKASLINEQKKLAQEFLANNPVFKAQFDKSSGATFPVAEINLTVGATQALDFQKIKPSPQVSPPPSTPPVA